MTADLRYYIDAKIRDKVLSPLPVWTLFDAHF